MHISKLGLTPENPSSGPDPLAPSSPERVTPKVVDVAKASDADFKLRSPQYREKVRQVLEWLSEPLTHGSYRQYDDVIDWGRMAESIENPTILAICHMVEQPIGRIVAIEGVPVTFLEEIPVKHRENPQKWCSWKGRSKVFVKWWLS